jgi:hypothetical protein
VRSEAGIAAQINRLFLAGWMVSHSGSMKDLTRRALLPSLIPKYSPLIYERRDLFFLSIQASFSKTMRLTALRRSCDRIWKPLVFKAPTTTSPSLD